MAYSNPTTKSGHNMFDMASLLQKAIRRGDAERAGFAAYELFGGYDSFLWKRLFVVSAEDCWGVLTKEIADLHRKHLAFNAEKKGYWKDPTFVSEAVDLLCKAKKSRDACYFACNFILSNNQGTDMGNDDDLVDDVADALNDDRQMNMLGRAVPTAKEYLATNLIKAIMSCDMENAGAKTRELMNLDMAYMWKAFGYAASAIADLKLLNELAALKAADEKVNAKKKPEERDPIFIAKAIMNMMYYQCGLYDSVLSEPSMDYVNVLDWSGRESVSIAECRLPGGVIPEYVFDVHTIKGKKAGKTDWGMNLVENDALNPFQKAFFEEGSWELRYDYKHEHGLCTEKEWQMSLEYRKDHEANPAKRILNHA